MTRPGQILSSTLAPRGLSRVQSAAHVGVGVTLFDELVEDGRMPAPKRIKRRKIWDRLELEEAFVALPSDEDANAWDEEVSE